MPEIGIWQISKNGSTRFRRGAVGLEKELEAWIEQDPTLIQAGLSIVGRQIHVEAGILDLLGLDQTGTWVIIEIKRGNIRRETVTQAIDYASSIDAMSWADLKKLVNQYLMAHGTKLEQFLDYNQLDESVFSEERAISVFVVGTGRDEGLDRLLKNLSFKGNPVAAINFDVFENQSGERLLLRSLTDLDTRPAENRDLAASSDVDRLMAIAAQNKVGAQFKAIYEAATECGLFPRTFKWSIMYTPPIHKNRVIVVTWVRPRGGKLDLYVASRAVAEFYPISEQEVVRFIGQEGRMRYDQDDARVFCESLKKLFRKIAANS